MDIATLPSEEGALNIHSHKEACKKLFTEVHVCIKFNNAALSYNKESKQKVPITKNFLGRFEA